MAALNPNLHAFTATLHAHVVMRSFPFLSADLVGTYYYKEPDKNKVVFTGGVPLVAQQFDKLYAHIESPRSGNELYDVTLVSDDGKTRTSSWCRANAGTSRRSTQPSTTKALR